MSKFLKKLILIIFFLSACSFEPIYKEKNYNFGIGNVKVFGDKQISNEIKEKLIVRSSENSNINYNLEIDSQSQKKIVSKDSKGNPSIFEITVTTTFKIKKEDNLLIDDKVIKKNTYNNISDKFELENYEKIIKNNLSSNISREIINRMSNLNQ